MMTRALTLLVLASVAERVAAVRQHADTECVEAKGSSKRDAKENVTDADVTHVSSGDIPAAATSFLRKVVGRTDLPSFKFQGMPAPGVMDKHLIQDMHVAMESISYSVPSDARVFNSKSNTVKEVDWRERVQGQLVGHVTKALCVFVNPSSGGRQGDQLLSFGQGLTAGRVHELVMRVEMSEPRASSWWGSSVGELKDSVVQVLFFEMTNTCSRKAGLYALRRLMRQEGWEARAPTDCAATVRAVTSILDRTSYKPSTAEAVFEARAAAAGGDGTITWLIDELYKVADPPIRVPVGVIPMGTGNDLSRQLNTPAGTERCKGAGTADALATQSGSLVGVQGTLEVTAKLMLAPPTVFDVWNVEVTASAGGNLMEMRSGDLQSVGFRCTHRVGTQCEKMEQTMGNYASMGFESMIGLDFEKWRSAQTNNSQFTNKAQYVKLGAGYALGQNRSSSFPALPDGIKFMPLTDYVHALQDGNTLLPDVESDEITSYGCDPRAAGAMGTYKSLVFMNVECIMGGERKWPRSSSFPTQPHFDDGRLEVLSFRSPLQMAAISGKVTDSCAVGQYREPTVHFKPEEATMAFQVDGEFYAGVNLKEMAVKFREHVLLIKLGKGDKSKIGNPTIVFGD